MLRIVSMSMILFCALFASAAAEPKITFKKTQLDAKFRAESPAVGDFNHDGKLDIAAGDAYYAAPDWKPVVFAEEHREFEPIKYSQCFNMYADDINGDGWTDLTIVEYPGQAAVWRENLQGASKPWPRHVIIPVANNESPQYLDVDGDGRREWLLGTAPAPAEADGPNRVFAVVRRPADVQAPWLVEAISAVGVDEAKKFYHGLGLGDLNGDGRKDIVTPTGWWKAPSSPAGSAAPWEFTKAKLGEPCAQMQVYDFDGDGDADVLSSAAHKLGIWWHEQTPAGWQTHLISELFSQTHALELADINGDGLPDFVTGKRYWAHGPKGDVNPGDPPVLYWFELARRDGKPVWTPHEIDNDSGVGTQIHVADVNGDGLLDVVTANKRGVYYFEQSREP